MKIAEQSNMQEIRKTKHRLIKTYTLVMGMILTAMIGFAVIIIWRIRINAQKEEFQKNVMTMIDYLKHENVISNDWLANQEIKNHIFLHIEDNGIPLKWHASKMSATERQMLLNHVMEQSKEDGLDCTHPPVSYTDVITNYYTVRNETGEDYYASVSVIPLGPQYRSLILFQNFEENAKERKKVILIAVSSTILIWLFIWAVNRFLIESILKPIREGKKKQTEFVACASHELKAPLAVIQSSTGALLAKPDELVKYTDYIKAECRRMAHLIDDMLLLASTETNTWKMRLEPVDLNTLLLDVYEAYESVCLEHGMRITLDLGEELTVPVMADESRMSQVLMILLDNAVQYSDSREPLELKKMESRNYVYLYVIDHGIGLSEHQEEHIFDKFYRGDQAHKDHDHYGLGLSIAKELIRLQGGMLSYLNTDGGGATFQIKLSK